MFIVQTTNMTSPTLKSFNVFNDLSSFYSGERLYYAHFQIPPSVLIVHGIEETKIIQWLNASGDLQNKYEHIVNTPKRKSAISKMLGSYLLKSNILVEVDLCIVKIFFTSKEEEEAIQLMKNIQKFKIKAKKTKDLSMVINCGAGLQTIKIKLKAPKLSIIKHYNDDLQEVHKLITKTLKEKNRSGVILFHGMPGTGKSTYIRYLIFQQQKKVIFMPPSMAGNLDTPSLTNLLIENRNSIIVIEDAEDLLLSRDNHKNSGISMLLNLTDGLLGESLGIQIIATFNTHVSNIDKALLRKGRLIALYEFKALEIAKASSLIKEKYPLTNAPAKSYTLAEIFNMEEQEADYKNAGMQPIGFLNRAV